MGCSVVLVGFIDAVPGCRIRHGFIRKVYGILTVQLLITTVMAACLCTDAAKLFIAKNAAILWVAMAVQVSITHTSHTHTEAD